MWRYHLPNVNSEGWCVAFLDGIGCFSVLSDYGNYGYRWPEAGWYSRDSKEIDFREFFLNCGDHYILNKIAPREVYDGEETMRAIKERILDRRRHGNMSREEARREWDVLVEYHCGVEDNEVGFSDWLHDTRLEEAYECIRYSSHPQAVAFIKHVLPRLRVAIRESLEAEKK